MGPSGLIRPPSGSLRLRVEHRLRQCGRGSERIRGVHDTNGKCVSAAFGNQHRQAFRLTGV
jgi:hypothetical protein